MVIPLFIDVDMLVINKTDVITNYMIMNMSLVNMRCQNVFKFTAQQFISETLSDFVSLFGCGFTRRKCLYDMTREMFSLIICVFSCAIKFNICNFRSTGVCVNKQLCVCLIGI